MLFFSLTACGGAKESPTIAPEARGASDGPAATPADPGSVAAPGATTPPGNPPGTTPPPTSGAADPIAGIGSVTPVETGFAYIEGPVWRADDATLLFSDIPNDAIVKLDSMANVFSTFRAPSGKSNGLAIDAKGRLIACESAARRVTRTLPNGTREVLVDNFQGDALNAPNDLIVRNDGAIYFTDPDYSIAGTKELSFQGLYRIDTSGNLALVADDMDKPNGIALSPDEATLYVSDEAAGFLRAYDLAPSGAATNPRKIAEVPHADGFAVDDDGNLYVSSSNGIVVLKSDGTLRGTIPVPKQPANCTFGGPARKTLFITAQDTLYKIELNVAGKP